MAAFTDFHRFVLPYVGSSVPMPAVQDALIDAARAFCERARVVTQSFADQNIAANNGTIDLSALPATDLEVCEPLDVWTTAGQLTPKTEVDLKMLYPNGWRLESVDAIEQIPYWISPSPTTIQIVPFLTTALTAGIKDVKVALRPTLAAATLPDILYQRWSRIVAAGALALLHSQSGTYADPKRVPGLNATFETGVREALDKYAHGYGKPILRTGQDEFQ